jgi:hypothetical protein
VFAFAHPLRDSRLERFTALDFGTSSVYRNSHEIFLDDAIRRCTLAGRFPHFGFWAEHGRNQGV